jgi:hypothetical protein
MPDTKIESVFDIPLDEAAEVAADAAADAEIVAGRGIPHDVVRQWLLKLAKGEKVPPPVR